MLAAAGLVCRQAKIICFLPDFNINSFSISSSQLLCCLQYHNCSISSSLFRCLFTRDIFYIKTLFDLTMIPIRSCLRMDDELVSNYGPPLRKSVTFNDLVEIFGDVVTLEPSPATSKSCSNTLNGRNAMSLKLPVTQPQRKRSVKLQRKDLRVSFSPFYLTIEPDGRTYTSVTSLEEEDDCWKPGAMDGEPLYIMNFQRI